MSKLWHAICTAWKASPLMATCDTCGYVLPHHHPRCPDGPPDEGTYE